MIKLSNPPVPEWDGIMAFMPVVGTYEFALSNDDMLIYCLLYTSDAADE